MFLGQETASILGSGDSTLSSFALGYEVWCYKSFRRTSTKRDLLAQKKEATLIKNFLQARHHPTCNTENLRVTEIITFIQGHIIEEPRHSFIFKDI